MFVPELYLVGTLWYLCMEIHHFELSAVINEISMFTL